MEKRKEKKFVSELGGFFFSSGIPLNIANDPYYLPIFEGVANYGIGFVPTFNARVENLDTKR